MKIKVKSAFVYSMIQYFALYFMCVSWGRADLNHTLYKTERVLILHNSSQIQLKCLTLVQLSVSKLYKAQCMI